MKEEGGGVEDETRGGGGEVEEGAGSREEEEDTLSPFVTLVESTVALLLVNDLLSRCQPSHPPRLNTHKLSASSLPTLVELQRERRA